MAFADNYSDSEPTRAEVETWEGPAVLEFGADWCPHCQGAQAVIRAVLADHSDVRHVKVADGKGKPLGRSFQVKLWPTLVFLRNGQEMARVVRPQAADDVRRALATILPGA